MFGTEVGGLWLGHVVGKGHGVFESLSDLQAIQSATRNKILRPVASNAPGASEAAAPRPRVLICGSFALVDQ